MNYLHSVFLVLFALPAISQSEIFAAQWGQIGPGSWLAPILRGEDFIPATEYQIRLGKTFHYQEYEDVLG